MKMLNRELNYLYKEFGSDKVELHYLDYTDVVRDFYGDIIGGTLYIRKSGNLSGVMTTNAEVLYKVYNNMPFWDTKQKALFKVSTKELYDLGVIDAEGNYQVEDIEGTGIREGFRNMFIRFKGEFYDIMEIQPAFIYRGEIGSYYLGTSKMYDLSDVGGKAKVVIGDPVVNRGEVIEIKSANSDLELDWVDITSFNGFSMTPLTPLEIYVSSITSIPNLSTSTVLVIGDLVYNIVSYDKTPEKDYKFVLEVNDLLLPSDIVTKVIEPEIPVEPEEPEIPVETELTKVTLNEPLYSISRVAKFVDIYSEGRWSYSSASYSGTSVANELSISEIPTTYKDSVDTILNVYSTSANLFELPLEVLVNSSEKTITETVVVIRGIAYVVIKKVLVEDMYRYELATTKYGTINVDTIPLPPVPDTKAPVITSEAITLDVPYKSSGYPNDSILKLLKVVVTDDSGEIIVPTIEGTYDTMTKGTYPLTIVAVDSSGNRAELSISIIVKDMTPPIINGANAEIEIGSLPLSNEDILTLLNIEVLDVDTFTVEVIGTIDTNLEGVQTVTIKATDLSGNISTKDFTITVVVPVAEYGREWEHLGITTFQLTSASMYVLNTHICNVGIVGTLPSETPDPSPPPVDLVLYMEHNDLLTGGVINSAGDMVIVRANNLTGGTNKQTIVSFKLSGTTRQTQFNIETVTKVEGTTKYAVTLMRIDYMFSQGTKYKVASTKQATLGRWV